METGAGASSQATTGGAGAAELLAQVRDHDDCLRARGADSTERGHMLQLGIGG